MIQHGLIALNTRFRKSKKKLQTFIYPNEEKAQLEYILGRKKWRNSFKNCQSYNSFDTSAPITESFPVSPLSKIDWKAVLCDKDLQNRYAIDVYNRYETLSKQMTETSTDDRYEALIATNAEVAENILPKKRKRKGIVFETPD